MLTELGAGHLIQKLGWVEIDLWCYAILLSC